MFDNKFIKIFSLPIASAPTIIWPRSSSLVSSSVFRVVRPLNHTGSRRMPIRLADSFASKMAVFSIRKNTLLNLATSLTWSEELHPSWKNWERGVPDSVNKLAKLAKICLNIEIHAIRPAETTMAWHTKWWFESLSTIPRPNLGPKKVANPF